jgi:hypothetical protein
MAFNVLFFFSFLCSSFSLCITNSLHCTSVGYTPQLATKTTPQVIVTFVGYGIFSSHPRNYHFSCTFFPVSPRRKSLLLLFAGTDKRLNDMSEVQNPNQQRAAQVETQTGQSTTTQRVTSNTQSQGRSASQADRSGRGDRQRIQRSSSSTSSSSSASINEQRNGARVEAPLGASSYQQYSSEGGYSYAGAAGAAGASLGASDGSFGSIGSGERRQGRHRRQVIRLPDQQQGQVRQVRRRLPTPEPDTLERV